MDHFTSYLKNHFNKSLLKHTAGLFIFCPNCERILDYKTVIIVELFKEGKQTGQHVGCTHCFKPEGVKGFEAAGYKVEVTKYEA